VKKLEFRIRFLVLALACSLAFPFVAPANATEPEIHDCVTASNFCITGLTLQYGDEALSLKATWTAPLGGTPSAYEIYLFQGSDYISGTRSAGVGSQLSASFTSLAQGDTYSVAVISQFNSQSPAFYISQSTPVTVIGNPSAPSNVVATRTGSGQVNLTWTAPTATGGSPISEYEVTCITTCSGSELGNQDLLTDETNITLSNLAANTSRTFTVTAKNSAFTSVPSAASNAITPFTNPTAPASISATAIDGGLTISSWGASSVTGATLTKYVVTLFLATDVSFTSPIVGKSVTVTNLNARTATISGLTNGTAYVVRVAGYVGEVVGAPRTSASLTPRGVPAAPSAPTAIRAEASASLSWNAPSNNGALIDYYEITYSTSATGNFVTPADGDCSGNVTGLSCSISGLTPGSTYFFKVRAHNSLGFGQQSLSSVGLNYPSSFQNVSLVTQVAPVGIPAALKAKKKITFPMTSQSGSLLTVSTSGSCKVSKVFKTVKVKVGKKTKRVKQQTGWSVQVLKKKKSCEIRQSSPEGNGYAALSASSQVLIK
jgi:hypothetical protein